MLVLYVPCQLMAMMKALTTMLTGKPWKVGLDVLSQVTSVEERLVTDVTQMLLGRLLRVPRRTDVLCQKIYLTKGVETNFTYILLLAICHMLLIVFG